jgi:hypothetical protein
MPHTLCFSVWFACTDLILKLRWNTEKAHTPFSLSDCFLLSLQLSKICRMVCCVALAIICKKKVGRRQLTRWKSWKIGYWIEIFSLTQTYWANLSVIHMLHLFYHNPNILPQTLMLLVYFNKIRKKHTRNGPQIRHDSCDTE